MHGTTVAGRTGESFISTIEPRRAGRPRVRILLSSAGRRVGLLRSFRSSANALGVDLQVFTCDVHPEWSPACLESDQMIAVPPATSPEFVEQLLEVCEFYEISFVVPTIDTELVALSRARDRFAEIGTTVVIGSPDLVEMARDKLATARFLAAAGIPSPRTASIAEALEDESWIYPVMAKPRHGSSSRGIYVIENRESLARLVDCEPYVVQEMLYGREFTVNLYFDRAGALKCAVPHERLKVRAGEVEKGVTVRDPELCGFARKLARALDRPFGAMCFQAIKSPEGKASLFEINARFGGGYPLAHRAGATFTRWLLEQQMALTSSANDSWENSVVMLRYDDAVFV